MNGKKIKNVQIGDSFMYNNKKAIVVDFYIMTSYLTKKIIDYKCIAILVDGLAKNEFEIPFATVVRKKIK